MRDNYEISITKYQHQSASEPKSTLFQSAVPALASKLYERKGGQRLGLVHYHEVVIVCSLQQRGITFDMEITKQRKENKRFFVLSLLGKSQLAYIAKCCFN